MAIKLKKLRKIKGKTQAELAETLQIDRRQWSRYENEINEIPTRHIITLCRFYNVSADWLLGIREEDT